MDLSRSYGEKAFVLVLVRLPDWATLMADQYGYLPKNVLTLKRVSALNGDYVCRFGSMIIMKGRARVFDNLGRKMSQWRGCSTLNTSQVFLLADNPKSFDGRCIGVTRLAKSMELPRRSGRKRNESGLGSG